jgi:hypothetical protein
MLLAGATANAAKCKFQDSSYNAFTKMRTTQTKWESLTSAFGGKAPEGAHEVQSAAVSAKLEGHNAYLAIRIILEDYTKREPSPYELENAISIPENSQLLILMGDDTTLRLPVEKELSFDATFVPPGTPSSTRFRKTDMNEYVMTTEAAISYVMDENTTALLRAQDATNMRVEARDTYYDIDIHKKSLGDVAAAIECLQQARAENGAAK